MYYSASTEAIDWDCTTTRHGHEYVGKEREVGGVSRLFIDSVRLRDFRTSKTKQRLVFISFQISVIYQCGKRFRNILKIMRRLDNLKRLIVIS